MIRYALPLRLALAGCLLALLAVSTPTLRAAPATPTQLTTIEGITEYRLGNGLHVLLFPDSSTPKLTVNLTVFVGSRHEGYGETGMAHLLEHMLFKGTPKHPYVPKALRDHGAYPFNGTTWVDRTNYYETLDASDANLEFAIDLEADRLVNSFVRREDLASEMTVVRNEFEAGENNPQMILSQRMLGVAYEWHNYGKSTMGNRSDIERVPIEKLQAFYHKYYQPDNAMLIVAGNFKPERALDLIARYFGPIPRPSRPLDNTYTEEPPQDGERSVTLRRVGTVGAVGAVYHIPAGAHPDFAPLEVLATLLDTPPSGRLYRALVTARKASQVSVSPYGWHDPGVLEVLVQVDRGQPLEDIREILIKTLEGLGQEKIQEDEVERARRRLLKNRELLMANSNIIGIVLSEWAAKGDWRLFFLHRDRIARVTPADISRVARHYLQRSNRTVGLFVPTDHPQRVEIPPTPDIAGMLKDYKGGAAVVQGESFDPTPANIEKRVQRSRLSGGVKTAFLLRKTRGALVNAELTLHYGNAEALKGQTSATQFLARLMARGTRKHTRQQLEDELDRLKVRLLPSGSVGEVAFRIECKRDSFPAALKLLGEILREPTFPAEEFDVLKREARDGLERDRTEPQPLAVRALQRKLSPYPQDDVRYVPTVAESIKRLEAVTLEQVRALYAEQLGGQSGEFVVVGDFDPEPARRLMDEVLADWKARVEYRRIERPAVPGIKGERLTIDTPDKANALYVAGLTLPLKDTDPDDPALEVADYLFGGGPLTSRLATRVRQKGGLSYAVGSHFNADALDRSARVLIYAICNPININKVDRAVQEELDRMRREGVTATELDEGKKAYLLQLKARRGDDAQLVSLLQEGLYVGRTLAYDAELEKKIAALTLDEVHAAFRKYVDPERLVIIRAGDFKKK